MAMSCSNIRNVITAFCLQISTYYRGLLKFSHYFLQYCSLDMAMEHFLLVSSFDFTQSELSGVCGWHHAVISALVKVFFIFLSLNSF